jgi:phage shock protein C
MAKDEIRRLQRSRTDRKIAGVCGGLGDYFSMDPVLFRLGFVLAALPGGIPGIILYVTFWAVIPEQH